MSKIWETISSKTVLDTKWFKIKHNRYILPNNKEGDYYFVKSRGSAIVVPITGDGKIVMIKQYRYLIKKISTEFPMGGVEDNQLPIDAAKAELEQEAGYIANKFNNIGEFNPFIGVTDEICHAYVAKELKKTSQNEDDTEKIEINEYLPSEVDKMIEDGIIWDGQSMVAWHLAKKHLK
jgi:ADP-ribose pyrophosphatase